ncbi:unnamed protein product [Urochloa humidicola]
MQRRPAGRSTSTPPAPYKRSFHLGGADNITPATVVDLSEIGILLAPTRSMDAWISYCCGSVQTMDSDANGHDGTRWRTH